VPQVGAISDSETVDTEEEQDSMDYFNKLANA